MYSQQIIPVFLSGVLAGMVLLFIGLHLSRNRRDTEFFDLTDPVEVEAKRIDCMIEDAFEDLQTEIESLERSIDFALKSTSIDDMDEDGLNAMTDVQEEIQKKLEKQKNLQKLDRELILLVYKYRAWKNED